MTTPTQQVKIQLEVQITKESHFPYVGLSVNDVYTLIPPEKAIDLAINLLHCAFSARTRAAMVRIGTKSGMKEEDVQPFLNELAQAEAHITAFQEGPVPEPNLSLVVDTDKTKDEAPNE